MKLAETSHNQSGFALIITITLLALLVLAVFALSALTRVSSRMTATSVQQTQAREHALLAMQVALGELQKQLGPDERLTAMAGVTGVEASGASTTRQWCGVWDATGGFVTWLASGAVNNPVAVIETGLTRVALVATGSVGASFANSEHVEVGKLPVTVFDPLTGGMKTEGNFAYWIADEGCKISAYSPDDELPPAGTAPVLGSNPSTSATAKLRAALNTHTAKRARILSYEQLALLPTPESAALAANELKDSFHHTALTTRRLVPQGGTVVQPYAGVFNINTNSSIAWRGLLETYNMGPAVPEINETALGTSEITSLPGRIAGGLAAESGAGKSANGPFQSVAEFGASALLASALSESGSGVTAAEFIDGISPMLDVRSDTFRIRSYGDVIDSVDGITVRSRAFCEAIVQRQPELAPSGLGRKFTIIYFRWLGREDL